MAKVKLNPFFSEVRGRVGDFIFRSSASGETIMSARPDMSRTTWSDAQQAHRQRFKEAAAYARAAMAAPDIRAYYEKEAASLDKRPYHLAVSDYLKGRNLFER